MTVAVTTTVAVRPAFILHFLTEEENYVRVLKPLLQGRARILLSNVRPTAVFELALAAKEKGITQVATSSPKLLQLLLGQKGDGLPSVSDYAGSLFHRAGCDFLILPPLDWSVTVPYGKHLFKRLFNKFMEPNSWLAQPAFEAQWSIFTPPQYTDVFEAAATCTFMSCDIETARSGDRIITCVGFTFVHIDAESGSYTTQTVVVPGDSVYNITVVRQILDLPQPKVFQNGKYDIAYLLRYNCPVRNYAFDTINLFHSWYSELPKDLGFIPLYLLRDWIFHKDEANTGDLFEYYRYNAKDSFVTALSFLALLQELPEWAVRNFLMEFPTVFPCVLSEATGIRCDIPEMKRLREQTETVFTGEKRRLEAMVAAPGFNPGSPKQVGQLFQILGCGDIKGTGKIEIDKASARHPLNRRIFKSITRYREDRKLYGTYLSEDKLWNGRVYYALNPHGTDTGRNASKESHFWCGLQIQNIPRDRKDIQIKSMFIPDPGFLFGEADLEQAEARDTAYLSGDLRLIATVDDATRDYHGTNASAFFGIPYEKIVHSHKVIDQDGNFLRWVHETLDKAIRDLAKRTNHGANYNMGASVMLDTMGIENVIRARKLLGLPQSWSLLHVCEFLLQKFAETYPVVKGDWYDKVKNDVDTRHMLVGPTGWTRYCFGSPSKNKRDLNRYVAHPPQSLNAMVLNKAFLRVFYDVWMPNQQDFKLLAQIHDSIFFQYREGRQDLAFAVKRLMEIPVQVRDTFGIERTLLVPAALKGEGTRWSELHGME